MYGGLVFNWWTKSDFTTHHRLTISGLVSLCRTQKCDIYTQEGLHKWEIFGNDLSDFRKLLQRTTQLKKDLISKSDDNIHSFVTAYETCKLEVMT